MSLGTDSSLGPASKYVGSVLTVKSVVLVLFFLCLCIVFADTQPKTYMESEDEPEGFTGEQEAQKTVGQRQDTLSSSVPAPTPTPVPRDKRGEELTFAETGHHRVFMFAKSNTFIQLDGNRIPTFQLR